MDTREGDSKDKSGAIVLIKEDGALFWYARNWYPYPEKLYDILMKEIMWECLVGNSYGKTYDVPRLMYHMGDDGIHNYTKYGGLEVEMKPWHPEMEKLRNLLEESFNCFIDTCLLNYYRDGNDMIAEHGDRESGGSRNITIGMALGSTRDLVFKRNSDRKRVVLENRAGDLYVMEGTIHKLWKHGIPRRKRVKEGRISATFRQIMPDEYHLKKREQRLIVDMAKVKLD